MSVLTKTRNGQSFSTLIDDFFAPSAFGLLGEIPKSLFANVPDANIIENKKEYAIELAVPGLKKDDFKVDLLDGVLTVSAEKEEQSEEEGKNFRKKEFSYNSFSRSFFLPENLSAEKIDAKYDNGVLRIKLPKKEATPSQPSMQIKVS